MKLTRRRWLSSFLLVAFACFLSLTGCKQEKETTAGSSTPSGGAPAAAGSKKIAVVVSTLNNPWFVVLADTASARAKELGYEPTTFDSQNQTAKESEHFDNIIAQKYAAILFNCTDADGSIKNVRRAKDAGIPVFCMDREINATDAAVSQVLSDSTTGCQELGKYFVQRLGEKGNYVELLGIPADNNTKARTNGFHSVVDRYPDLKMVAQQTANFDRAQGAQVMQDMLQAHKDIKGVFCGNDAMALGAYQALQGAGMADKVLVFGFDGADDAIKSIADGKIAATVMQYPKVMARTVAESADKYLKGDRSFQQKIPVKVDLVTKDNVANFADYGKKDAK